MRRTFSPWPVALAAAILLLAAARLLLAIPAQHLREDEMLSFRYTEGQLVDVVRYQATQDNQAPLWYVLFRAWRTLAGDHETTARILSALLTLLTTAITYRLARRWFGGLAGIFSAIALLGSVYLVPYALEIRPYALALLMAAASMWAFDRWLTRPTVRRALIYGVSAAGLLYTHYFLAFLVLIQGAFALISGRPRALILRSGLTAAAAAALLFSVQIPVVVHQLRVLRQLAEQAGQIYGLGLGAPHTSEPTTVETVMRLIDIGTNGAPLIVALVLIAGGLALRRAELPRPQARSRYLLALAWGLGVPAAMLLVNLQVAVYSQRYAVYAAIGLALAVGGALALLRPRWLAVTAAVGLSGVLIAGYPDRAPVRIPYRDIYTALSAVGGEVLSVPPLTRSELAAFNADRYLTLPVVEQPTARDVWFVTSDWFNDQVQAAFRSLERTHPLQTVLGQCNRAWCYLAQHMQAPPLDEPVRLYAANGDALGFLGIDRDAVAPDAIRTRLWWQISAPVTADYTVALHVYAPSGALVAQADGPIVHYGRDTMPTSLMEPGRLYIDWRTVIPQPPLAPGTYTLALIVYQGWDGARLTTVDGGDQVTLGSIILP